MAGFIPKNASETYLESPQWSIPSRGLPRLSALTLSCLALFSVMAGSMMTTMVDLTVRNDGGGREYSALIASRGETARPTRLLDISTRKEAVAAS
jgi:hypothetical protein